MKEALGHAPEELPLALREALTGKWVALELYDPKRLPLRKIEAVGGNAAECFAALRAAGKEVTHYEVVRLAAPL